MKYKASELRKEIKKKKKEGVLQLIMAIIYLILGFVSVGYFKDSDSLIDSITPFLSCILILLLCIYSIRNFIKFYFLSKKYSIEEAKFYLYKSIRFKVAEKIIKKGGLEFNIFKRGYSFINTKSTFIKLYDDEIFPSSQYLKALFFEPEIDQYFYINFAIKSNKISRVIIELVAIKDVANEIMDNRDLFIKVFGKEIFIEDKSSEG